MKTCLGACLVLICQLTIAEPLAAQKSGDLPLPRPRPDVGMQDKAGQTPPLPRKRPEARQVTDPGPASRAAPPFRVYQTACAALLSGRVSGKILPPIAEGQCGARSPIEVTGVVADGRQIAFSAPLVTDCQLAGELAAWLARVSVYARTRFDRPIARVLAGTSYQCRTRNKKKGGFVSEHGFANAVDIIGFELENGHRVVLPADWQGDDDAARVMRFAHETACGHFTTVLGPDANALHRDHLHLDMGCHGRTCTARLCQ